MCFPFSLLSVAVVAHTTVNEDLSGNTVHNRAKVCCSNTIDISVTLVVVRNIRLNFQKMLSEKISWHITSEIHLSLCTLLSFWLKFSQGGILLYD